MTLFWDKCCVLLMLIGGIAMCSVLVPIAAVITLYSGLTRGDWQRDAWADVVDAWSEALNNVVDFLAL